MARIMITALSLFVFAGCAQTVHAEDPESFTIGFVKETVQSVRGTATQGEVEDILTYYISGATDALYLTVLVLKTQESGLSFERMSTREQLYLTAAAECALELTPEQIMYLVLATPDERNEDLVVAFVIEMALAGCE